MYIKCTSNVHQMYNKCISNVHQMYIILRHLPRTPKMSIDSPSQTCSRALSLSLFLSPTLKNIELLATSTVTMLCDHAMCACVCVFVFVCARAPARTCASIYLSHSYERRWLTHIERKIKTSRLPVSYLVHVAFIAWIVSPSRVSND